MGAQGRAAAATPETKRAFLCPLHANPLSPMPPIPRKVRRFVERQAPEFVSAVRAAREEKSAFVPTALPEFEDDMTLLYASLWYGATCGVTIVFVPPDSFDESDEEQDASDICDEQNP